MAFVFILAYLAMIFMDMSVAWNNIFFLCFLLVLFSFSPRRRRRRQEVLSIDDFFKKTVVACPK